MKGKKLARVTLFYFVGRVTLLAGPTLQHVRSISNLVLPAGSTRSRRDNRELKQRRLRRQQEQQKKNMMHSARASRFFVPFFAVVARLRHETA